MTTDAPEASPEEVAALAQRLQDAARNGDTQTLMAYVDAGVPVDVVGDAGDTFVMLAAYHGHAETVQELLDRGADPNLPNAKGQTPLAGAVFKGFIDVVRVLAANGADPDAGTPSARAAAQMFDRQDLLAILDR
ncbi:MAG: ankyrin repeat domain-containing protein [Acidimicrobiales bacterium]|nr:ankyrin repeat domain-containing protein [Acidimicrobiales bacterium]